MFGICFMQYDGTSNLCEEIYVVDELKSRRDWTTYIFNLTIFLKLKNNYNYMYIYCKFVKSHLWYWGEVLFLIFFNNLEGEYLLMWVLLPFRLWFENLSLVGSLLPSSSAVGG